MIRVLKKLSLIAAGCICLMLSIQPLHAGSIVPSLRGDLTWQEITNVQWSTDNSTWGNTTVNVGDTVYFQFTMYKQNDGEHYKDFVKAWMDWDQNGTFSQSEDIFFAAHMIHENIYSPELGKILDGSTAGVFVGETYTYTSAGIVFNSEGTFDMLVRTVCSGDLSRPLTASTWNKQWTTTDAEYRNKFSPDDATYYQGDAWMYQISVVSETTPPAVPEPSAILLIATGLIGIAGIARRKK